MPTLKQIRNKKILPTPVPPKIVNTFDIDEIEDREIKAWQKKHLKKCKLKTKKNTPSLTYRFRPTHIGTVLSVKCECGKKHVATNYGRW